MTSIPGQPSSDEQVLTRLGQAVEAERLRRNITQEKLAFEAGISRSTLRRLEGGQSTQLTALIRVLRALDLLGRMELLLPSAAVSPIQALEQQGQPRQRASSPKDQAAVATQPWSWGEDE